MKSIKLPFGLTENNTLVHVTEVERGKKCNCLCPACKSPLIAAKGSKKQPHFKHAIDNECESGLESAIHLAAKKIIKERKSVTLPKLTSLASASDSRGKEHSEQMTVVENGMVVHFDSIQEEVELQGMRADLVAQKGRTQLIIEIFYSHKVDDCKLLKISESNISTIEINLSDLRQEDLQNWKTFWKYINDPLRSRWLYNAYERHHAFPKLEMLLVERIRKIEEKYKQEEKQKEKEKAHLLRAIKDLEYLSNSDNIEKYIQKAGSHPTFAHFKNILFSNGELPHFVNVDVPDGDWIFGCERCIWQLAVYYSFIYKNGKALSIRRVDDWLQNKFGLKTPRSAKIAAIYGRRYPELVPLDISASLPSSWRTLRAYFDYLCELGILEFSGSDYHKPGNFWYRCCSQMPVPAQEAMLQA